MMKHLHAKHRTDASTSNRQKNQRAFWYAPFVMHRFIFIYAIHDKSDAIDYAQPSQSGITKSYHLIPSPHNVCLIFCSSCQKRKLAK